MFRKGCLRPTQLTDPEYESKELALIATMLHLTRGFEWAVTVFGDPLELTVLATLVLLVPGSRVMLNKALYRSAPDRRDR